MTDPIAMELTTSFAALATFVVLLVVAVAALWRRQRVATRRLERLASTVAAYADASTQLATTVERLWLSPDGCSDTTASRRYVLRRAADQIDDGAAPSKVVARLGLSAAERQLLLLHGRRNVTHSADQRAQPVTAGRTQVFQQTDFVKHAQNV